MKIEWFSVLLALAVPIVMGNVIPPPGRSVEGERKLIVELTNKSLLCGFIMRAFSGEAKLEAILRLLELQQMDEEEDTTGEETTADGDETTVTMRREMDMEARLEQEEST